MKDEILAHLYDALRAGRAVKEFVAGTVFEGYVSDDLLRSGVERKLEIIGEALNRIRRDDPGILDRIRDHRDIISFRNILVHGYDGIDDQIVWDVITGDLDNRIADVERLLAEHRSEEDG